jgi:hypothetical protein
MASETRPGVIVVQELAETPAAVSAPTLVPVVVGPCYQIVEALESDGSLNSDAKYADEQYNQAALAIPQADLPDPRSNLDEVNVDETEVGVRLYFGGLLSSLARGSNGSTGSAFLKAVNDSARPAFHTDPTAGSYDFSSGGSAGLLLTLSFDTPSSSVTADDVTISFADTMLPSEVAEAINDAVGADVAEEIDENNTYGLTIGAGESAVLISSTTVGAAGNITIRANSSATPVLMTNLDETLDHRIEGSGFRGQDDDDGDLVTPWIEWHRGAYKFGASGTALTDNAAADDAFNSTGDFIGLINLDGEYSGSKTLDVTFTGASAVVPLSAATATEDGDEFWADGSQVGSAVVTLVEARRFKIGTLSLTLSTFDEEGNPTSAIYSTVEVNTLSHGTPFAPKYAYFIANNLVFGEVTPEGEAATVTGSLVGLAPQGATIYTATVSSDWLTAWGLAQDVLLAGATLTTQLTEDGVQADEASFNFSEGSFAGAYGALSEIATDLTAGIDGVTVTAIDSDADGTDDTLLFVTDKTGSDQSLSLKTTGTNSIASSLGITSTLSADGKDYEFAEPAKMTGDYITLPLPSSQSDNLVITVVDSFGTHTFDLAGVAEVADATLDDVAQSLTGSTHTDGEFPIYLYNDAGGLQIATMSFVDADGDTITDPTAAVAGRMVVETVQGGSGVDVSLDVGDTGAEADLILLGFTETGAVGGLWDTALTDATGILDTGDQIAVTADATTFTFTAAGAIATPQALISALNVALNWSADPTGDLVFYLVPASDSVITTNVQVGVRSLAGAALLGLDGTEVSVGLQAAAFENASGTSTASVAANNTDTGVDELSGTRLGFTLDENPYVYEADFVSNSLAVAVDLINELVGGSTDIASESGGALVLTSSFVGAASAVEIDNAVTAELTNDNSEDAGQVLGLTSAADAGAGRPNPDFYQDGEGTVYIGANILRNRSTGIPYSLSSALADVYFDYTGLRLDVTAAAEDAELLSFESVAVMDAAIGPISTDNPLALACFLQLSNAPSQTVSVLGVSEVSAAAEMGTVTAYAEALEFLESKEAYAIAPLTDDVFVQQLFATHVESMSAPEERGERIAFIWQGQPDRAADTSIWSGTDAETNGTDNSVTLGDNPGSAIIGAGATDLLNITVDDAIYMELVIVALGQTIVRNYSLSAQNGVVSVFRTSFAAGENDDGFYSTATLDGDADYTGMTYSLRKRGDELLVEGTDIPDLAGIAEAAAAAGESYASRRVFHVFCDSVDTSIDGVVTNVPGYYVCAAITGLIAEQPPQQPFTRPFSENQMDTIADGGRYIMINQGGRIASRHQRSTATTSIEARELSITKSIDFLAKGLRATNRVYIGRYVINPGFIDQLVMSNEGFLARSVQSGVVNSAALRSVLQDESAPDTVLIEVEVAPAYPCNKIRITIVS